MNKKRFISAVLAAALTFGSTTAFAQENGVSLTEETIEVNTQAAGDSCVVGDFKYTELEDGTLEVSCNNKKITQAEIPATVNGKSVTIIRYAAFESCTSLTSVTIPDSVISIGGSAFAFCKSLTSVTIPNSVTSIDLYAFKHCTSLTSVTLQNNITSIKGYAFEGCASLTSVTIPDSITSIGYGAFFGCTSLAEINVNAQNKDYCSINGVLFTQDKTKLLQYPAGKTAKSYLIPNGTTNINTKAFESCTNLTSVTLPDSVTSISGATFSGCTNLAEINVDSRNEKYCSVNGVLFTQDKTYLLRYPEGKTAKSYTIPDGANIDYGAFSGCTNLTSVTIPNSVTYISNFAFSNCAGLISVTIPSSVTEIGMSAFSNCTSLTSVTMPNSFTIIGKSAFSGCTNLTSVMIPNSTTKIYDYAFFNCTSLKNVYYAGTESEWNKIVIDSGNAPLLNATIHYNSTGPTGSPVDVTIKAPDGVDVSGQTATVTVNGEAITLPIVDGLLDVSILANGKYTFTFSANNCAPRPYDVTISNGTVTGLDKVELNLYGDINGDKKINASDILKAKLQVKGSQKLSDYDFTVADVTKDGKVNSTDILRLKLHVKGSSKLW